MSRQHRRNFIRKSFLAIAGASAGCRSSVDSGSSEAPSRPEPPAPAIPEVAPPPVPAEPSPAGPGHRVSGLDQLPPGSARTASLRGLPVIVINHGGTLSAVSAICTHENCEVEWRSELGVIQCPCHDGRYDTRGRVLSGPPPAPLVQFQVVVEEGSVFIVDGS